MKKLLFLPLILLGLSTAYGQTLGLKISPNLTVTSNNPSHPGFSFSGGLYYDQHIYKHLGLSTGILFTQFKADRQPISCFDDMDFDVDGLCPTRIDDRFDILEIPINLTLDFSMHPDSKWKFLVTGGYSFGQIINTQTIHYYSDKATKSEITNLTGLIYQLHFFDIGFEVRDNFSDKINFAFGGQYKYTGIYDVAYGGFNNWNIFIKTGLNFVSRK